MVKVNQKVSIGIGVVMVVASVIAVVSLIGSFYKTAAQPAPVVTEVQVPRPVSDVKCGETYQFDHLERFNVDGRVAVNFYFGGEDRNLRPQYIWDKNVLGQSTEIRKARAVVPALKYSLVIFLCQSDSILEGHEASNVEVMRYVLTLRRPLRPQTVIRNGGQARK